MSEGIASKVFDPEDDIVNHPSHYETDGIECIDAMIASQGKASVEEYCINNAFKYIWRSKHKGSEIEDIKKAIWYLNKFIALRDDSVTLYSNQIYKRR